MCEYAVEHNSAAGAGGLWRIRRKHFIIAEHSFVHFALAPGLKLRGKLGICFGIACIHFFIFFACARPAQGQRLKVSIYVLGNIKRRILPAKALAHVRNNIIAKGRTVRACGTFLQGAVGNVRMHYYKGRLFGLYARFLKGERYGDDIFAVFNVYYLPAH